MKSVSTVVLSIETVRVPLESFRDCHKSNRDCQGFQDRCCSAEEAETTYKDTSHLSGGVEALTCLGKGSNVLIR